MPPPLLAPAPPPVTVVVGAQALYVDANGNDAAAGTQAAPLRTLYRAQELMRAARVAGKWPAAGFVVIAGAGRLEFPRPLALDARDSGDPSAPVVYLGTSINGLRATELTGSIRLQDAPRSAHERAGYVRIKVPVPINAGSQVTVGKRLLIEARWPKDTYTTIKSVVGLAVTLAGDVPVMPVGAPVSLTGFVQHEWRYEAAQANAAGGSTVQAKAGAFKVGSRAMLTNSPHLLDEPDEYILELATNSIVVHGSVANDPALEVSVTSNILLASGAKNVRFAWFALRNTTGNAVEAGNVDRFTVAHSEICNTGGMGGRIIGTASGFEDDHIHSTGLSGVYMFGGDRGKLIESGNMVESCYIEDVGRRDRSYTPGVRTEGIGSTVRGNVIRNLPHVGIIFSGNSHLLAFNDISDVVKESGDMGAIYAGRDWTCRGNVIRGNVIYDIPAPATKDPRGVYLDDQFSSALVEQNIFASVKFGVFVGGGRDNVVRRNAFFRSSPSIFFDARGLDYPDLIKGNKPTLEATLAQMPVNSAPWLAKFPEVARLKAENPMAPVGNRFYENAFVGTQPFQLQGPSQRAFMQDSATPFVIQVPAGVTFVGKPNVGWFRSIAAQLPGAETWFPWAEFDERTARAHRARAASGA